MNGPFLSKSSIYLFFCLPCHSGSRAHVKSKLLKTFTWHKSIATSNRINVRFLS